MVQTHVEVAVTQRSDYSLLLLHYCICNFSFPNLQHWSKNVGHSKLILTELEITEKKAFKTICGKETFKRKTKLAVFKTFKAMLLLLG